MPVPAGWHEALPDPVPPLCEWCFGAIRVTSFGSVVMTRSWPGAHGLPVFLHSACRGPAVKALRSPRVLDRDPWQPEQESAEPD